MYTSKEYEGMINSVKAGYTAPSYKKANVAKARPAQNVSFAGAEFNKFTKETTANAAKGMYKATVKAAVKGYDAAKKAVQDFDSKKATEKAKEVASNIAENAPSKLAQFKETVKKLTNEAVEEARKITETKK